jgi:hypothetical protein
LEVVDEVEIKFKDETRHETFLGRPTRANLCRLRP